MRILLLLNRTMQHVHETQQVFLISSPVSALSDDIKERATFHKKLLSLFSCKASFTAKERTVAFLWNIALFTLSLSTLTSELIKPFVVSHVHAAWYEGKRESQCSSIHICMQSSSYSIYEVAINVVSVKLTIIFWIHFTNMWLSVPRSRTV